MSNFLRIVRLQLRMLFAGISPAALRDLKADKKKLRSMIAISLLLLFSAGMLIWVEVKLFEAIDSMEQVVGVFVATPVDLTNAIFAVMVMVSMLLSVVYGLLQLLTTVYFSKDLAFYATLPVTGPQLYAARFCQVWFMEAMTSLLFIMPPSVIYVCRYGFDILLLIRALAVSFLAPVLPLAIGCLLCGLLSHLGGFWKHREFISTALTFVIVIAYMVFSFSLGQVSGSSTVDEGAQMLQILSGNLNLIQTLTRAFPPAAWGANAILGSWSGLGLLALASAAAAALVILLFGHKYLSLAALASESEGQGKAIDLKTVRYESGSYGRALIRQELRELIRTPSFLINVVMNVILVPLMVCIGMGMGFRSGLQEEFRPFIEGIISTPDGVVILGGVYALMLCFMCGMNMAGSTAVSREGRRHSLYRTLPVSAREILLARLKAALIFEYGGVLVGLIVLTVMVPYTWASLLIALFFSLLLSYAATCVGLVIDCIRPKTQWNNDNEVMKQNFNPVFSMMIGLLALILLSILTWVLVSHGISAVLLAVILTASLLLLCALAHLWLFRSGVRHYSSLEV